MFALRFCGELYEFELLLSHLGAVHDGFGLALVWGKGWKIWPAAFIFVPEEEAWTTLRYCTFTSWGEGVSARPYLERMPVNTVGYLHHLS
jgi:hypothetical protein